MGEQTDDSSRTALRIDTPTDRHGAACDHLSADADAWLLITYDDEDGLTGDETGSQPDHIGQLVVDDQQRSEPEEPDFSDAVATGALTDPTDLSTLGTAIGRYLRQWEKDDLAICFDSVTALLEHVDEDDAFKFMHLFVKRIEGADAAAHFHLNAGAHNDATIKTFTELVDRVERPDEPDAHATIDRGAADETSQEDIREHLEQVADGGVPFETGPDPERPAVADIDEATDQEIADTYADL